MFTVLELVGVPAEPSTRRTVRAPTVPFQLAVGSKRRLAVAGSSRPLLKEAPVGTKFQTPLLASSL